MVIAIHSRQAISRATLFDDIHEAGDWYLMRVAPSCQGCETVSVKRPVNATSALLAAVSIVSLFACGPSRAGSPTASIDQLFAAWNQADSPGCAVGVSHNGAIVYEHGYGMANLERGVPITPETVFQSRRSRRRSRP